MSLSLLARCVAHPVKASLLCLCLVNLAAAQTPHPTATPATPTAQSSEAVPTKSESTAVLNSAKLGVERPSLMPMVLSLVFVLSLVPVSMWFLKRTGYNRSGKGGSLRIVSSLALGQKERLIVVDDGHEHILLGVTAHTINRLGTVPPPPASAAAAMPASNAFVQLLQRARSGPLPPSTHAPQ